MKKSIYRYMFKLFVFTGSFIISCNYLVFAQENTGQTATTDTGNASSAMNATYWPKVGGTIQMLGELERLPDENASGRDKYRMYLFESMARLHFGGTLDNIDYFFLIEYGSEETPKNRYDGTAENTVLSLTDAYIDAPLISPGSSKKADNALLGIRIGQFIAPYSREVIANLSNPESLPFAAPSINTLGFNIGRDTGVALHGTVNNFAAAFGIFTGGGIDVPQRYLPEELKVPLLVARIGYTTLDKSIFNVKEFDPDVTGTKFAAFISGLYEKDSAIGHSTVMDYKMNDVSLFYDHNWNPYLSQGASLGKELGSLKQAEADFAVSTDMGGYKLNGGVEANIGKYENSLGSMTIKGGEVHAGVYLAPVELALRYAVLFPSGVGYYKSGTTYPVISTTPINEITPGLTWYITNHLRITADLQFWIHVPVAIEPGVGAYNLMEMPDQDSLAASGDAIQRRNAISGRLNFQFVF